MSLIGSYFRIDYFSAMISVFILFFTALTVVYSAGFMRGRRGLPGYYLYIALTAASSICAVLASHLFVLLVCWGLSGILLYLLVNYEGTESAAAAAKKALIIIGGTDALLLLGILLIWKTTGTLHMGGMRMELSGAGAYAALACLLAAAFAKAGGMPFHSWIPDVCESVQAPVSAFLPASLDKLLGIYFLARISLTIFNMTSAMNNILMFAGSVSIIAAGLTALMQQDMKRLLGFCAVSQAGYMILGIGTGNPVGIAGGIFHMLNYTVCKSCLFFAAGLAEKQSGTADIRFMGGLARYMPVTFATFFVSSLALSGVPPLNGFFSKWMIYQSLIENGRSGGFAWIIWLSAAVFGSALTLAYLMKLVHAVFLCRRGEMNMPLLRK